MRQVADRVFQLPLSPRSSVNAYLVGDVLVDAGLGMQASRVIAQVRGRPVTRHVLTHAHPDHAGGSRRVVDDLGVPVAVGERDLEAARSGVVALAPHPALRAIVRRVGGWAPLPEATALHEGDEVGPGFRVLDTPGHSAGHISLWRASDGVLICGDVVMTMSTLTTVPGLHEPLSVVTPDRAGNRESVRRIAALEPRLVLAGHGPPLAQAAVPLRTFAAGLA